MAQREPKPGYPPDPDPQSRPERAPASPDPNVERARPNLDPRVERVDRIQPDDPERVDRIEIVRPLRLETPAVPVRAVSSGLTRVLNAVDYAFFLIYGLLGIRLVLTLMGAREGAAFTQLIGRLTAPLYAPFDQIVARPKLDGGFLDFPIIIALMAYGLLHVALRGLVRVIQGRAPTR